jgi:acyl-CoA synthetase (AMP-forming)/AMP-acid ligase II
VLRYRALLDEAPALEDRSGGIDDLAFLNYTGGTTGKGKGVMHSHRSHFNEMNTGMVEGFFAKGNTLLVMPLFHIGGIGISNSALMMGNTLVILPAFDPGRALQTLQQHRIAQALMVPTMWQLLIRHPEFDHYDLSNFRYLRYGASPIDEPLLLELRAKFPGVDFMQIYGQTEGVPATLLHDVDHSPEGVAAGRTRSAGTPAWEWRSRSATARARWCQTARSARSACAARF